MQDRIFDLDGVRNFRDFGGYDTLTGGKVRAGALFRSAHFAEATDADVAKIKSLGIEIVCDLRRPEERKAQVCRWPDADCATRVLASEDGGLDEAPHLAFLRSGDLSAPAVRGFMRRLYAAIPFDARYVSLFSSFFSNLAEGDGAALVHCAAGKDRTGILCALTLIALDVPEEAVVADYELTNTAVDLENRLPLVRERFSAYAGRDIPLESVLPFLGVDRSYLATAMEAMRERNDGAEGYLRDVLAVDESRRNALRARLLA
jgi:protein-tyrosine phosphatase